MSSDSTTAAAKVQNSRLLGGHCGESLQNDLGSQSTAPEEPVSIGSAGGRVTEYSRRELWIALFGERTGRLPVSCPHVEEEIGQARQYPE
jgi:hypothetical protein